MAPKRAASSKATPGPPAPWLNAILVVLALAMGLWLLVQRGHVSWPPRDLLQSLFTVSGCLALIGPLVLFRGDHGAGTGVGDSIWLTGGLLVWVFDVAALLQGDYRAHSWTNPLSAIPMGLSMLAVLVAAWRAHAGERTWTWTNVTGWALGIFWIGLALWGVIPTRLLTASIR